MRINFSTETTMREKIFLVLIYSDNYMSHDKGYLRFFCYISFFNISMLGLVTSSNLI
jgi:NAD(P)H-quinone oxidoreductase subunit 5